MNADPLIANETQPTKTVAEMVRADERLKREFPQITLPVLILHGTKDVVTKPSGSEYFHGHAGSADRMLKLYEGHVHDLNCGSHCPLGGAFFDGRSKRLTADLCIHCLLIEILEGLVLVDTGYGAHDMQQHARGGCRGYGRQSSTSDTAWRIPPPGRSSPSVIRHAMFAISF